MVEQKLRISGIESIRQMPSGLYEVVVRSPEGLGVYYADPGGKILIAGHVIDAASGHNLTEERHASRTR
jgi:hypothetical protein